MTEVKAGSTGSTATLSRLARRSIIRITLPWLKPEANRLKFGRCPFSRVCPKSRSSRTISLFRVRAPNGAPGIQSGLDIAGKLAAAHDFGEGEFLRKGFQVAMWPDIGQGDTVRVFVQSQYSSGQIGFWFWELLLPVKGDMNPKHGAFRIRSKKHASLGRISSMIRTL